MLDIDLRIKVHTIVALAIALCFTMKTVFASMIWAGFTPRALMSLHALLPFWAVHGNNCRSLYMENRPLSDLDMQITCNRI
jgi:hypothetical protein